MSDSLLLSFLLCSITGLFAYSMVELDKLNIRGEPNEWFANNSLNGFYNVSYYDEAKEGLDLGSSEEYVRGNSIPID